jgi:hypothetical protein
MEKLTPTEEEVKVAMDRLAIKNPGTDYISANQEAIEKDGYKNEKCPKCNTTFLACIHFIMCAATDCPMKCKKDTRSLLDMLKGDE